MHNWLTDWLVGSQLVIETVFHQAQKTQHPKVRSYQSKQAGVCITATQVKTSYIADISIKLLVMKNIAVTAFIT